MSGIDNMIGRIVTRGYMATWHEQIIYLHDSRGKRWAEIDPFSFPMTLTVDRQAYRLTSTDEVLSTLNEVEDAR